MAAIPMTPSRFGSSFSGSQAPYNANAPSMADTLPSADFNFNDLRERMAQFTKRFDDFIEHGRKRVLEERNAFRMSVAELEGEIPNNNTSTHMLIPHAPQNRNATKTKPSSAWNPNPPPTPTPSPKKRPKPTKCTAPSTP